MSRVFEIAFQLGGELTSSFKNTFGEANSTLKTLGAAAAAIGGAIGISQLTAQVADMSDALAKLSAQTGTFGSDMEELGGIAENLFRDNYGETFDDVTVALANVKQNMKTLDGSEFERMTANALVYADTFDAEINEITRAANNTMNSFGVSSEKAMDLFVTGTQRGLNFSGELLDNVAEYAPLFGEMGYSAEQYFGILERGGNNAYNLDYLNDIMKEFQIRVKDGSKATSDAMALMSKDTNAVWDEFLKGNGTVSDVSSTVVSELKKMDDQVLAGQIGVGLFGTKWEDLEATTVYAMLGSAEAMTGFEGAMESINQVRFDTFGKAIQGIGRILFMDLVYPMGDAVLPVLNSFANILSDNLPKAIASIKKTLITITPIILGIVSALLVYKGTLAVVGAAQKIYNAVQKASILLYNAHRAAMIAYALYGGGLKGIIQGMAAAQRVLNITMLANPFVAVAAAIIGISVAFYAAYKMSDRFRGAINNTLEAVKNFTINARNYTSDVWDGFVKGVQELPGRLTESLSSLGIGKVIGDAIGKGGGFIDGFINTIKAGFSSLPGILSMVAPMLTTMGLSFLGVTGPVGLVIGGIVSLVGFLYRLSQTNEGVANAISSAWESLQTAFAPIIQVLSDGFEQFASEVGPELTKTFEIIANSITEMGPSFAELGGTLAELGMLIFSVWSEVGTTLISAVLPLLLDTFTTIFPEIVAVISTAIPIAIGLISSIIPIVLQVAQIAIPSILSVVQMVFPLVLSIIQSVLPIVNGLLVTVAGILIELAQIAIPILLNVVQMAFPMILTIIQTVIPIVATLLQVVVTVLNMVVIPAIQGLLSIIQFVFPLIQLTISNSLAIINGVLQAAMALLRGDWDGAWQAIKGTAETIMKNIIGFFKGINLFDVGKSIVNGLINGIKSMGSTVLSAISSLVPEPLRKAASGVMKSLGIAGYADGGIVSSPELAWVGEGGDVESIIPWNNSQRSKDLWLQTGQALGMLNKNGMFADVQQQIALQTQSNDNPVIRPDQVSQAVANHNNSQIVLHYNPQYNVKNPADLQQVKEYAEQDKDDLAARLAEIKDNERRTSFDD